MWGLLLLLLLQEAFYYLALSNTRRVSRLSAAPESLAVWALELLQDAAEGALKFVQVWFGLQKDCWQPAVISMSLCFSFWVY